MIYCFNFKRDSILYFVYIYIYIISLFPVLFLVHIQHNLDIEYDALANSNSSFHVGAGILNLLFLYDFFIFFHL